MNIIIEVWSVDDSLSRLECTASVVSTSCSWGTCGCAGHCARIDNTCSSNFTSYLCNTYPYKASYICQKTKKGIFSKNVIL